jgi:uncharacterized protein
VDPARHLLASCTGFEWDDGNAGKNLVLHAVTDAESEQVFLNHPLIAASDVEHSTAEHRYYALGHTNAGRQLFVAFTIRNGTLIRVISARDMTRRELNRYAKAC